MYIRSIDLNITSSQSAWNEFSTGLVGRSSGKVGTNTVIGALVKSLMEKGVMFILARRK